MELPSHIKEVPPERDRVEYECICGSSAAFDYPLDMEKNEWWFLNHADCPYTNPDGEEIYQPNK